MPSQENRTQDKGEGADNSDSASDETNSDLASLLDTPLADAALPIKISAKQSEVGTHAKPAPRQDDAEVKAAVTALLSLHSEA